MPKATEKSNKIVYPPGCKEINEDLNKDELIKRLKNIARAFQEMGQDDSNAEFEQLAFYLANEFFLDHSNKDVRLLTACCIADVFRIFAPDAPYSNPDHVKEIFLFLTRQLRGLENPESPSFKRYFYLLENLAWVKSFTICIELEENLEIFCQLFRTMFSIVSDKHSSKVISFILDLLTPLIQQSDSVSQELMDIILSNIIEPFKSQNRHAYNLAKELIRRTANALEPCIQTFFNNALMLGKTSESDMSARLYDLIYELNIIAPSVLLAVLPQLDFKLKSNDEEERKAVTKLLAKMFSDPDSDLATQNQQLWNCFLGRFNDIDIAVRRICVQSVQMLIVNHPELVGDLVECLEKRALDPDENVRLEVVQAIIAAFKKDVSAVQGELQEKLLEVVKNRSLDKKYKIRKESLIGLGQIYKRCMMKEDKDRNEMERLGWIRNKVLYAYYQISMEDKCLVERILNISFVPFNLEPEVRMRKLYHLYSNIDTKAVKALQEVFKSQTNLRMVMRSLLDLWNQQNQYNQQKADLKGEQKKKGEAKEQARQQAMLHRIVTLSKGLPDSQKALEHLKRFYKTVQEDSRIRGFLMKMVAADCSCKKAEECVKEILKKMGNPIPQNPLYNHVKQLFERISPVMIDSLAVKGLMSLIDDAVNGIGEICEKEDIPDPVENGMKLLTMLSHVYPGSFQTNEVMEQLIAFVTHKDETISDSSMEIFVNVGSKLEQNFPQIHSSLLPVLKKQVKFGSAKQVKHAVRCIAKVCPHNKDTIYSQIFEHLKKNMDLESTYFIPSMVAIGHMAQLCPGEFASPVRGIVTKFIVKELLMQDRGESNLGYESSWIEDHLVSEETNAKLQAMKMMVRWLMGMRNNENNVAISTLRLLSTMLTHDGDLMEKGRICKAEMARLRLGAGCAMMKLAQEPVFADLITLEQFQSVAYLLVDPVFKVREIMSQKLHKGLIILRLPLQYMSIFCLAGQDVEKERKVQVKSFLQSNINKRRDLLKTSVNANAKMFSLLPDYVLPYAIHLLAHDPELKDNTDVDGLKATRECLWFLMEPLIKNEKYSYSFYRRMIENIKQTKDKQNPDDLDINYKMYAVCDLALSLVMTKTANFLLKDFPAEPCLPARFFTQPDQNYSNTKCYLPPELIISNKVKKTSLATLGLPVAPATPITKTNTSSVSEKASSPTNSSASESLSAASSPSHSPTQPSRAATSRGRQPLSSSTSQSTAKHKANSTAAPRRNGGAQAKGQGKITDFISPSRQVVANKNNKQNAKSQAANRDSDSADESLTERSRGRGRFKAAVSSPLNAPTIGASIASFARKRKGRGPDPSDSEPDTEEEEEEEQEEEEEEEQEDEQEQEEESPPPSPSPVKKGRGRGAIRQASSGPAPVKRGRGRPPASSQSSDTSESTSGTASPSTRKSSTRGASKESSAAATKKSYPVRSSLRRGAGGLANGTSDGEDNTPDSKKSSPASTPRKRASQADDVQPNVKRSKRRR